MAFRRPLLIPALACGAALAVTAPAHASLRTSLRAHGQALSETFRKQTSPETGLVGRDLPSTLRNLQALVGPADTSTCEATVVSKPFAAWGDRADYIPAPNGGFEQGLDRWVPVGPVSVVDENEPFFISGTAADQRSVALPEGSSIASDSFCAGLAYPTIRLMTKAASGPTAKALVTVRYTGKDGLLGALPLGVVTANPSWGPSEITLTGSGVPLMTGTKLGITLTSIDGTIAVDDVYIDPYRRA